MNPKSKRTEVVLSGMRWMNRAAVHEFGLPNRESGRWESLCSPTDKQSVLAVALTPDKKLVLVRQYRFPVESFAVELPGGVVDPGESASEAVGRELLQETGYATDKVEILVQGWNWNAKSDATFSIYLATGCKRVREPELDLVERYTCLSTLEEEPAMVASKIAIGDPEYRDPILSHALLTMAVRGLIRL